MERFLKALNSYVELVDPLYFTKDEQEKRTKQAEQAKKELAEALECYVEERIQRAKNEMEDYVGERLHEEKFGRDYH